MLLAHGCTHRKKNGSFYFVLSRFVTHACTQKICVPLSVAVFSISYRVDLSLKILRDDSACPGACQVIQWYDFKTINSECSKEQVMLLLMDTRVKGCFDALDKKYVRHY